MTSFLDSLTPLNALEAAIVALQWEGSAAFQRVELFDITNLELAVKSLLAFEKRLCIIVHDSESFENFIEGSRLTSRQSRRVLLIIGDQVIGDRQVALLGDANTPGILKLKDLVLNGLFGALSTHIYAEPLSGEVMQIIGDGDDPMPGRVTWIADWQLSCPPVSVTLGRTY